MELFLSFSLSWTTETEHPKILLWQSRKEKNRHVPYGTPYYTARARVRLLLQIEGQPQTLDADQLEDGSIVFWYQIGPLGRAPKEFSFMGQVFLIIGSKPL